MNISILARRTFDVVYASAVSVRRHLRVGDFHILHGLVFRILYQYVHQVKVVFARLKRKFIEGKGIMEIGVLFTEKIVIYRPNMPGHL